MAQIDYEEEEYSGQINSKTVFRFLSLLSPHRLLGIVFIVTIGLTSVLDSYFTYLSKRFIDEGIIAANRTVLIQIVLTYGLLIIVQAFLVFGFIYTVGILGERIRYELRKKMFNHLHNFPSIFQPNSCWLDYVTRSFQFGESIRSSSLGTAGH